MRKTYKKLTKEQIERGVIFSSQLMPEGSLHEVLNTDTDAQEKIKRLLNDSFFNESNFRYNEVRQ